MLRSLRLFASLSSFLALSASGFAEIRYVASRTHGAADGTSWSNSFGGPLGVRNALAVAVSGDQIWVAKGLYLPTSDGDRSKSLVMIDGVDVYGGFAGTETSLQQRDPVLHETTLSGDLAGDDATNGDSENSCHVVRGAYARLDGFTITGGNSDGSDGTIAQGSAYFTNRINIVPSLAKCAIRANHGRAVYWLSSGGVLIGDCRFEDNAGGALMLESSGDGAWIDRCVFTRNSASKGSAIDADIAFDVFVNDSLFFDNTTEDGTIAGELETYLWITGCTIAGNHSTKNSGAGVWGIYRQWGGFWNSIVYFNEGGDGSQGFDDQVPTGYPIDHCCIQGGPTTSGNIDVDPGLVDLAGGDLRLSPASPCIDAGGGTSSAFDVVRSARRQDVVEVGDTGSGPAPVVDMGAFESSGGLYSIVCGEGIGELATACPCGNYSFQSVGRGCRNSINSAAGLFASGTPHPDTVVLTTDGMPHSVLCLFLQGNALLSSGALFGDGVRCVGGAIKRLGSKTTSTAGIASYPNAGDTRIATRSAALGDPIPNGATRWYQTWYRDPSATFCPPPQGSTFNISAGIAIVW